MINIAMLSKWHVHASDYARQFTAMPNVKVTAVWDTDTERGSSWAKELKCTFFQNLDSLLSSDIDAVCVCTETSLHPEVISKCAKAGKHIFTEKVLAVDTAEANKLAREIADANIKFLISYRRLCDGRILYLKKLLDDGIIGALTHLHVRDAHDGASTGWLPPSFYDLPTCGGGAMMDLGAHPMYLSLFFLGEPSTVTSVFTEYCAKGVDDNCVSVLEYENGAIAVSETGFVSMRSPFTLELNGTNGTLFISDALDVIVRTDSLGTHFISKSEIFADMPTPAMQFIDCIENNTPSPFTAEDGVRLTRLMNAAYKSADLKETVVY